MFEKTNTFSLDKAFIITCENSCKNTFVSYNLDD